MRNNKMINRNTLLVLPLLATLALHGCGDFNQAYIAVGNDENTPGSNITTIWITNDCANGWGDIDAEGLDLAPGQFSPKIEIDIEPLRTHGAVGIVRLFTDRRKILGVDMTYREVDVLACFSSGTCGEEKRISVSNGETEKVEVNDEGKPSPSNGYRACDEKQWP